MLKFVFKGEIVLSKAHTHIYIYIHVLIFPPSLTKQYIVTYPVNMAKPTAETWSDPLKPESPLGFEASNMEAAFEQKEKDFREWEATQAAQPPPKKRLIVCCDGTWQSSNHGLQSIPSNVAKISRSVSKYTRDQDGTVIHQVVFYDAGVGTAADSVDSRGAAWAKTHQGAYGEGLDENVCEAYNFLVSRFRLPSGTCGRADLLGRSTITI